MTLQTLLDEIKRLKIDMVLNLEPTDRDMHSYGKLKGIQETVDAVNEIAMLVKYHGIDEVKLWQQIREALK